MAVQVLYEDNHLIAVYKPVGVLVQGDKSGDASLMDDVKEYLKNTYKKPGNVCFSGTANVTRIPRRLCYVFKNDGLPIDNDLNTEGTCCHREESSKRDEKRTYCTHSDEGVMLVRRLHASCITVPS
jgi:hypothetical protein